MNDVYRNVIKYRHIYAASRVYGIRSFDHESKLASLMFYGSSAQDYFMIHSNGPHLFAVALYRGKVRHARLKISELPDITCF